MRLETKFRGKLLEEQYISISKTIERILVSADNSVLLIISCMRPGYRCYLRIHDALKEILGVQ